MAETYIIWWFLLFVPLGLIVTLRIVRDTGGSRVVTVARRSTMLVMVMGIWMYGVPVFDALINEKIDLPSRATRNTPIYRSEQPGRFWFDFGLAFLMVSWMSVSLVRARRYRKRIARLDPIVRNSTETRDEFLARDPIGNATRDNKQLNYYPVVGAIRVVITEPPGTGKKLFQRDFPDLQCVASFIETETLFELADFNPAR